MHKFTLTGQVRSVWGCAVAYSSQLQTTPRLLIVAASPIGCEKYRKSATTCHKVHLPGFHNRLQISLALLPVSIWPELQDVLFLIKCIKDPSNNFNNLAPPGLAPCAASLLKNVVYCTHPMWFLLQYATLEYLHIGKTNQHVTAWL